MVFFVRRKNDNKYDNGGKELFKNSLYIGVISANAFRGAATPIPPKVEGPERTASRFYFSATNSA